jgi:hypothetical protein
LTTKAEGEQRLNFAIDTISGRTRELAIGVLAFSWSLTSLGIATGKDKPADELLSCISGGLLKVAVVAAVLALILDLIEYIVDYLFWEGILRENRRINKNEELKTDRGDRRQGLTKLLLIAKCVATVAAGGCLIFSLTPAFTK